jgi:CorA-like Mg2+ transporter protein
MKQRQANIMEAKSTTLISEEQKKIAVKQAEIATQQKDLAETQAKIAQTAERQGEVIMLFTIVTIIFLPLGTIASIYGMNAHEFGQGGPKLQHIWKVLFGISLPLAVMILYIAFHGRSRRILTLCFEYIWFMLNQHYCFSLLMSWEDRLHTDVTELRKRADAKKTLKLIKIKRAREAREKKFLKRSGGKKSTLVSSPGSGTTTQVGTAGTSPRPTIATNTSSGQAYTNQIRNNPGAPQTFTPKTAANQGGIWPLRRQR